MWTPPEDDEIVTSSSWSPPETDEVITRQNGNPGLIQQTMNMVMPQIQQSPAGLLNMGVGKLQEGAKVLGQKVTNELTRSGIRPLFGRESISVPAPVARGIGKAVQYAPDIAMMAASPVDTSKAAVKAAVPMARRALGFQKRFLNTPFARGQATKAAETALEEGVISGTGNPQTMFQRASNLATKSGEAIKKTIKEVPVEAQEVWQNLDNLRNQITMGIGQEGNMGNVHKAIDAVQNDIADLISVQGGPSNKLFAGNINRLKNRIGNSLNYLADVASQDTNKDITTNLANTIREAVKKFTSPEEFTKYLENQRLYNAAALMKKGLNNEIAGQMGNRVVGPYSAIAATGQLAAGQPLAAATTLGLTEGLMRRGMGAGAAGMQALGKVAPKIGIAGANVAAPRIIQEYLERAGGDQELARRMAMQDGYDIPFQ